LFDKLVSRPLDKLFKDESELTSSFGILVITPEYEVHDNDENKQEVVTGIDNIVRQNDFDPKTYNGYIPSQVLLTKGDKFRVGIVAKRRLDENGKLLGKSNANPILDT
jgi:hypothetical protein